MTRTTLAAALLLIATGSLAHAGGKTRLRPGETVDRYGFSSIDGYKRKNEAREARYARAVASGKIKDPFYFSDRAANARSANPPGVNLALELSRPWFNTMLAISAAVNPIGTELAARQFVMQNAWRLPF